VLVKGNRAKPVEIATRKIIMANTMIFVIFTVSPYIVLSTILKKNSQKSYQKLFLFYPLVKNRYKYAILLVLIARNIARFSWKIFSHNRKLYSFISQRNPQELPFSMRERERLG
jgi:hypothetical protein